MSKVISRFNPYTGIIEQMPVYGDQFFDLYDPSVSMTTSTTFQNKMAIVTPVLKPAAVYYLTISYGWNHDSTSNDFEARLFDTDAGAAVDYLDGWHKHEPQDSGGGNWQGTGSGQRYYISRRYRFTGAGVVRNFELQYRTDSGGTESSIWEVIAEFKRVG